MMKRKLYILDNTIAWLIVHQFHWYMLFFMICTYVLTSYESYWLGWYNAHVIPVLGKFVPSIWSFMIVLLALSLVACDIVRKARSRYKYSSKTKAIAIVFLYVLLSYRISGLYEYVSWLWIVSYIDVLSLVIAAYVIAFCVSRHKIYNKEKNANEASNVKSMTHILKDWPIENDSEDVFGWKNQAESIAEEIQNLDKKKTWSLAITAPWGSGKSSFMNLIVKGLDSHKMEVILFNPRDSKSYHVIQEDFFNTLACTLAKYNSGCSNVFKDYMASLQLIDNRGFVEKAVNFYKIWNKKDLKEEIKEAFSLLHKKVLIVIDDFDRLSKEEIMEVLKLIDSNAAFNNLIFLTAYDKEQVNRSLGENSQTKDACFVDKFFNIEYHVPARAYTYISNCLLNWLYVSLESNDIEKQEIYNSISSNLLHYKSFLPTLRDVKRYINMVALDYTHVKKEVIIDEYLLLHLVKYKYPEEYNNIHNLKYLTSDILNGYNRIYNLKPDTPNTEIRPILEKLFPKDTFQTVYSYRHIYSIDSFEYYFANQLSGSLAIKDMETVFSLPFDKACAKIDGWNVNQKSISEFVEYLDSLDIDKMVIEGEFIQYAKIVSYVATISDVVEATNLFYRLINLDNLEGHENKYRINIGELKQEILVIITEQKNNPDYTLLQILHFKYKGLGVNDDKYLIKDAYIFPMLKQAFISKLEKESVCESTIKMFYNCIDHMDKTRHRIFDQDCLAAMHSAIINDPAYYINTFVKRGSNFYLLTCEPFYKQIFGDESNCESFIEACRQKQYEGSELVSNFWRLYKANGYHEVPLNYRYDIQDRIEHKLCEEVEQLSKLEKIQSQIMTISDNFSAADDHAVEKYQKEISTLSDQLSKINLNIALKSDVENSLNKLYEMCQDKS